MIQRIQSVFYVLATICFVAFIFLPILSYQAITEMHVLRGNGFGDEVEQVTLGIYLLLYAIFMAVFCFTLIFYFKNRGRQMVLTRYAVILSLLIYGLIVFIHYNAIKTFSMGTDVEVQYGMGLPLPLVAALLLMLAYRGVKKDEQLVRSVDRLR